MWREVRQNQISAGRTSRKCLTLYRTRYDTVNDVALADKVQDNDWDNDHHDTRQHGSHFYSTIATAEILNQDRNRLVFRTIKYKIRKELVVPYPHSLKNTD